jgi:hypothetical protein
MCKFECKAFWGAFNALPVRGYCARDSSGNPFLSEARKRLERIARARVCGKRQKSDEATSDRATKRRKTFPLFLVLVPVPVLFPIFELCLLDDYIFTKTSF